MEEEENPMQMRHKIRAEEHKSGDFFFFFFLLLLFSCSHMGVCFCVNYRGLLAESRAGYTE